MSDKSKDYNSIAAFGEANRDLAAHGLSTSRKPWATPQVILGTMEDTEAAAAGTADGGTHS